MTYLGPYLRCTHTRVEKAFPRLYCPKPACLRCRTEVRFPDYMDRCYTCGTALENRPHLAIVDSVAAGDVIALIQSKLILATSYAGIDDESSWAILIPAKREASRRLANRDFEIGEDEAVALGSDCFPNLELSWFSEAFSAEIAKVKEQYGEANVAILWGCVTDEEIPF